MKKEKDNALTEDGERGFSLEKANQNLVDVKGAAKLGEILWTGISVVGKNSDLMGEGEQMVCFPTQTGLRMTVEGKKEEARLSLAADPRNRVVEGQEVPDSRVGKKGYCSFESTLVDK